MTAPPRLVTHLPARSWLAFRTFDADVVEPRSLVVHDHASVVFYRAGRSRFWLQGLYTLTPGQVLLVPAGMPHRVIDAHGAQAIGFSVGVHHIEPGPREAWQALFAEVAAGGCATRVPADPDAFLGLLQGLSREATDPRPSAALAVHGHLALLATALLRADRGARAEDTPVGNPVVAEALAYLHRHATEGISLVDVARHVARSPSHVATLVKQETGETVVGWILRARLRTGRQLLLHTDASIEAVARRCGFASPSHFHRAFKRSHALAPGAWRRARRSPEI